METRITVLISGNGTNLQALIDALKHDNTPPDTKIIRVISNKKDAYGLQRAKKSDIPTAYHNLLQYKKKHPDPEESPMYTVARQEYDKSLAELVLADAPDLVVCAGWMHILSDSFLDLLKGTLIINLHPALPDMYDGAKALERAYADFVAGKIAKTGVMVHEVISAVDKGNPILVREIPMIKDEALKDFEGRVHEIEWEVIVEGTRLAVERLRKEKDEML